MKTPTIGRTSSTSPSDPLQSALADLEARPSFTFDPIRADVATTEQLVTHLADIDTKRKSWEAAMNNEIAGVKLRYEPLIQQLNEEFTSQSAALETWADKHRAAFPEDKKTLEFLSGSIGFKKGSGAVAFIDGWDKAKAIATLLSAQLLGKLEKLVPKFLRLKIELDVSEINKAFKAKRLSNADGKKFGCRFVEKEKFFLDLKPAQSATSSS